MSNKFDPASEGRNIGNAVYHAAVTSDLAICCAKLIKWAFGGTSPRLDFTGKDIAMLTMEMTAAVMAKDMLVNMVLFPQI